jgi:hypothetical protein
MTTEVTIVTVLLSSRLLMTHKNKFTISGQNVWLRNLAELRLQFPLKDIHTGETVNPALKRQHNLRNTSE